MTDADRELGGAQPAEPDRPLTAETATQLRELAHELRNPLNALAAVAEIFHEERFGALPNDQYRRYAELAHEATQRMILLCDRLMLDSTALSGPVRSGPVDLAERLESVVDFFRPMADERGVTLNLDIKETLPAVSVNSELVTSALNNLVANSIKFTPRGGRVSVIANRDQVENVAILVVSDTGVGIDPEQLSLVMSAETPGVRPTQGVHGDNGSGMGLYLVRRSVQMMGGSLDIRSKQGLGTTAVLRLPISSP